MATYAQQSDLCPNYVSAKDLAALTDDVNPAAAATVNADIVTQHLTDASGVIDSFCRGRYQTPLQQCADVVSICCKLATFTLFSRRRNKTAIDGVQAQYDAAMKLLRDISAGKANLDLPLLATPQAPVVGPQVSRRGDVFSDRNLEGFCSDGRTRGFC